MCFIKLWMWPFRFEHVWQLATTAAAELIITFNIQLKISPNIPDAKILISLARLRSILTNVVIYNMIIHVWSFMKTHSRSQPRSELWKAPSYSASLPIFHQCTCRLQTSIFIHYCLKSTFMREVPPSPDGLSIRLLNVVKCCQSAHFSTARQANRINPGLTRQAWVQSNGLG